MQLSDFLTPGRVHCNVQVSGKKRALEYLSQVFASELPRFTQQEILNALWARERLGSTGFGNGVAIPHARLPQQGAAAVAVAFLQLEQGIDYNALDEQPVDLLCALVVPENCHQNYLEVLAHLAAMLSDEAFCKSLRDPGDAQAKYQLLIQWQAKP